jgi:hypothetical protein
VEDSGGNFYFIRRIGGNFAEIISPQHTDGRISSHVIKRIRAGFPLMFAISNFIFTSSAQIESNFKRSNRNISLLVFNTIQQLLPRIAEHETN